MDIQQLRYFLTVVRLGSIARAAETLNITQSGISRSLKALETHLGGAPLFIRNGRGIEPSPYGLKLTPHARAIVAQHEHALEEIRRERQARGGLIRLGVTMNFTRHFVPELMLAMFEQSPAVDLVVEGAGFNVLVDKLRAGELDLILGILSSNDFTEDLVLQRLTTSRSSVYCGPGHRLAGAPATTADLAEAEWVLFNSDRLLEAFLAFFTSRNLPLPRVLLRTNSPRLINVALAKRPVLTVMPDEQAQPDVASGALVRVDVEAPAGEGSVGLMYREGALISPAMRLLIDLAKQRAAQRL